MKNVNKTGIEFLTHAWNPVPGCLHGLDICATADKCWARNISHRFKRDFRPHVNLAIINPRFPQKPGARIGVNFMGDLFGEWWFGNSFLLAPAALVRSHVKAYPEHKFFFLTKNPARYAQFNPWPENAWLGLSLCGIGPGETYVQEAERLDALERVEGGHRWLSYEPILNALWYALPDGLEWLVMGVQTGPGAEKLEDGGIIEEAIREADQRGVPVFLKDNLLKMFPEFPRRREMP